MKIIASAAILLASGVAASAQAPAQGIDATDPTVVTTTTMFLTPEASDFVVSDLIDEEIHNLDGEEIGTIEDFVVRDGNTLTGVVASVGGFLGLGETYVVVDPNALTLTVEGAGESAEWNVVMDTDRDTLEAAPRFEYDGRWDR